ncbi:hypothetical protein B0H10DRAFT_2130982 [Mycena sp. CBHHK59/15]|nr:hypothetical protein B0H10DRAFT_2130982 [Mycena sp. CBHHK59/15]
MEEQTHIGLPVELERDIFELAAWLHPETIQTLILVAKRVCIWIEPLLYHVVLLRGGGDSERLLRMMDSKPPEFLREHVRHLALSSTISRSDVKRILSMCTNITDLALWTGDTYPDLLSEMGRLNNLAQLSINLYEVFGRNQSPSPVQFEQPAFSHLTHLDIFSTLPEVLWPVFGKIPHLTHLSFTDYYVPELLAHVIDVCQSLQVLIVLWTQEAEHGIQEPDITDQRFCLISCPDFEEDWNLGAWGGMDFWAKSDAFVERKRQGLITGAVYWVPA